MRQPPPLRPLPNYRQHQKSGPLTTKAGTKRPHCTQSTTGTKHTVQNLTQDSKPGPNTHTTSTATNPSAHHLLAAERMNHTSMSSAESQLPSLPAAP